MKKGKKVDVGKVVKGGLAVLGGFAAAGLAKYGSEYLGTSVNGKNSENAPLVKTGAATIVSGGLAYAAKKKKIASDYGLLASGGAFVSAVLSLIDAPMAKPVKDVVGKFLHGEDSLVIDVTPQNAAQVARAIMPAARMNGGNSNPMGGNQIAFAGNQIAFAGGNSNPMGGRGGRMGI